MLSVLRRRHLAGGSVGCAGVVWLLVSGWRRSSSTGVGGLGSCWWWSVLSVEDTHYKMMPLVVVCSLVNNDMDCYSIED